MPGDLDTAFQELRSQVDFERIPQHILSSQQQLARETAVQPLRQVEGGIESKGTSIRSLSFDLAG